MKYRTLIIDDELLARERLKMQLLPYSDKISLVGMAENGDQAVEMIDDLLPDLIFLDIQMPGKNGFDVLKEIKHTPVVIFCTAHDEYALKAFETSSIDYLVKPVKEIRLNKTIEKLSFLKKDAPKHDILSMIEQYVGKAKKQEVTSIPVKIGDRVVFIKVDDITYFSASDKYVIINTKYNKEYIIEQSLNYLEERLDSRFQRVQRSCLVNCEMIKEVNKYFGGRYILVLEDGKLSKITTGRKYADVVKNILSF